MSPQPATLDEDEEELATLDEDELGVDDEEELEAIVELEETGQVSTAVPESAVQASMEIGWQIVGDT
ncbi:hypothetical protein AGMMS49938_19040 [Fibrobacterales bacterium]|nr:hypothetical protein AGMMS49938_19040 [Fibrobacterales bacterium]